MVSSPSLDTIHANIHEPDARDANDAPQIGFAEDASRWSPLDDEQPDGPGEDEEGQSQEEEEL